MIREVPAVTPVTNPLLFTVATAGVALVQTPPEVALDNCVVLPIQAVNDPVIAFTTGKALMVTVAVCEAVQPFALVTVYVITEVPEVTPVTIPVVGSMVATAGVALLQAPPVGLPVNVVVLPTQAVSVPLMVGTVGKALTVIFRDATVEHPVDIFVTV